MRSPSMPSIFDWIDWISLRRLASVAWKSSRERTSTLVLSSAIDRPPSVLWHVRASVEQSNGTARPRSAGDRQACYREHGVGVPLAFGFGVGERVGPGAGRPVKLFAAAGSRLGPVGTSASSAAGTGVAVRPLYPGAGIAAAVRVGIGYFTPWSVTTYTVAPVAVELGAGSCWTSAA